MVTFLIGLIGVTRPNMGLASIARLIIGFNIVVGIRLARED